MNRLLKKYLQKIGKKGGKAKTPAKAEASRQNGKMGGRPKGGIMKGILLVLIAVVLSGCGSAMVSTRGKSTSAYAPSNETEFKGGLVKYVNGGAKFIKEGRRESAYKQMYRYCAGPYKITYEGEKSDGAYGVALPGPTINTAYYSPVNYWYMGFECDHK